MHIDIMQEPTEPPRGGSEYSPFQPELDQQFPVADINFDPESKDLITQGQVQPMAWVRVFRSSPAQNMEAEILMGRIITEAMRAGQWVDMPEPEDEKIRDVTFADPQGNKITIGGIPLEFIRGADTLVKTGLAERVRDEGRRSFIRPTEKFAQFVGQRIGFRPPAPSAKP